MQDDAALAAVLNTTKNFLAFSDEGNLEMLKLLVCHGAKINIKNKNDETPLHLASMSGELEAVKYLVSKGAAPLKQINYKNYIFRNKIEYLFPFKISLINRIEPFNLVNG